MMVRAAATPFTSTENNRVLFPPKFTWSRCVAWARVLLALIAPAVSYFYLPPASVPLFYGLMLIYLGYATFFAVRGEGHIGMLGLLVLFGDTVYFLIMATYGTERLLWLASLFFLFLLNEALLFYSPREVVLIAGVCGVFCTVISRGMRLDTTVVVAGALASGFAVMKRRQTAEIERLIGQLAESRQAAEKA